MKKRLISMMLIAFTLFLVVCIITPSSDSKQHQQQEEMLQQSTDQLGLPNITNFQEKKLMKQIMELCDSSDLICYAYSFSEYTGKYNYIGQCIGFGLSYGTEYTNPEKIAASSSQGGYAVTAQADPNGLFKAPNVQATWVCMIDDKGEKYILYNEPNIAISSKKLPKTILNSVPDNY